jgi:Ca2+-binding RTX toxin-like protein
LTALTLVVALPSTAFAASTVSVVTALDPVTEVDITKLVVDGGPEVNTPVVGLAGGTFTVTDATAGATAGPGCSSAGANTVTFPAAGIAHTEINGNDGADVITGSPIADVIEGGPGADRIDTGQGGIDLDPGSPTYCANSLDSAGTCGDNVDAGQGFDTVTYASRTTCKGAVSLPTNPCVRTDMRPGRSGADSDGSSETLVNTERIVGTSFSDELVGGIFNDTLNGGPGNAPDILCGALGKDTVDYSDKSSPVNVTLNGILATDTDITSSNSSLSNGARADCRPSIKRASGGVDNGLPCTNATTTPSCADYPKRDCTNDDGIAGEQDCVGEDVENVIGSPGDDTITGNDTDPIYGQGPRVEPSGVNVLDGGGGNDLLDGGTGPDTFIGGADFDAVTYEGRPALAGGAGVQATIDGSANDGSSVDFNKETDQGDEITGDIEDIIGSNGDDVIKGDGNGNVLIGGPGNDLVQGESGRDDISGDEGNDTLEGGDDGDLLDGGPGDDFMHGGFGNDGITGGGGTDTVDYHDATIPVSVTPNGLADDGRVSEGDNVGADVESLIGGLDDDTLVANGGNGILEGNGGTDTLDGGLGADILIGGPGRDVADYRNHPGPVDVNLAVAGGDGMADEGDDIQPDVENAAGSQFDDVIAGNGDSNYLNGSGGNDRISGAEGEDFLAGDVGNDTLNGDVGNDILDGAEGNDTLNGTAGDDTLRGYTGNDVLDGGAGADNLSGGQGLDTVTYASRSADVTVDTSGTPDDGEKGENDMVRIDVENVTTGSGNDDIDIADGATGIAICGGGTDKVTADASDEIGSGCEESGVKQAGLCTPTKTSVKMSKSGQVTLRLSCAFPAKGSVALESAGKVKTTSKGKAKKLKLGSKSFTGKLGVQNVKVKLTKQGRSVIKRKGKLRVQTILKTRRSNVSAAKTRTDKTKMTVKASGK